LFALAAYILPFGSPDGTLVEPISVTPTCKVIVPGITANAINNQDRIVKPSGSAHQNPFRIDGPRKLSLV